MTMTFYQIMSIILPMLGLLGGLITVWVVLQSRITALEVEYKNMKEQIKADTIRYERFKSEIRADIDKLYQKIDEIKNLLIQMKS